MNSLSPDTGNDGHEDHRLLLKDIQTKWKFSEPEVAALKTRDELVAQLQAKYRIDATQAGREVDSVLKGRLFQ